MSDLLEQWDNVLVSWPERPSFLAAISNCCNVFGYAPQDVDKQLRHVIKRCRVEVMRELFQREQNPSNSNELPSSVLVLTSGGVPGLVLEAIAASLTIGAVAYVRPSHEEWVLDHLLGDLFNLAPQVAEQIELISEIDWLQMQSAIVYGTDETVEMVKRSLPALAANRVAAYGSREGIAVVSSSSADDSWAEKIADDVLTFRQRGCMSPSWLYVLADDPKQTIDTFGRALASRQTKHVLEGSYDYLSQRRAKDADVLSAIAAGLVTDTRVLYAADARVTVVPVASKNELLTHLASLKTLLQTAVLSCSESERSELETLLYQAGCTRVVEPGKAHFPDPLWPQDGLGRIAPLLG